MKAGIRRSGSNFGTGLPDPKTSYTKACTRKYNASYKDSGQRRTINGYDCHEVVMTITVRQEGKALKQGGGYLMTSHLLKTTGRG